MEAARHLAQRALRAEPGNLDRQMRFLSNRLLARELDERELRVSRTAHQKYLRFYDSRMEDARKLVTQGESKADASLNAAELAALTMTVNQLLNLDEALVK